MAAEKLGCVIMKEPKARQAVPVKLVQPLYGRSTDEEQRLQRRFRRSTQLLDRSCDSFLVFSLARVAARALVRHQVNVVVRSLLLVSRQCSALMCTVWLERNLIDSTLSFARLRDGDRPKAQ